MSVHEAMFGEQAAPVCDVWVAVERGRRTTGWRVTCGACGDTARAKGRRIAATAGVTHCGLVHPGHRPRIRVGRPPAS